MAGAAHVLIVEARFYEDLADELFKGASEELAAAGATCDRVSVPGAFEIPAAVRLAVEAGNAGTARKYDAYVTLGCVIRGETTHYDYVCSESARGIMDLSVQYGIAIGYGILTCENGEQAWVRARVGGNGKNKGGDVAKAALRMFELRRQFGLEPA
jgi:6,7-dimethyl-8-ribityllumazine synthase